MESAIAVRSLTRDFGDRTVVKDVSFEIAPGSVVGLLGPNGAGKTTILKILACHLAPTSGDVVIGGHAWSVDNVKFKGRVGFLTREMSLYDRLTVRENLAFFAELHGLDPRRGAARTGELSETLDLGKFLDTRYAVLSTGQKQRANIAVTLLHHPDVLLLDEITASLDVLSCRHLLQAIRREADAGKAVLYSTHVMSEAEFLCDKILFLHDGRILDRGTPKEIIERHSADNLTDAFFRAVDRK